MASAHNQAVLIVTGAWHVPAHYSRLSDALQSKGVRVICECLPTNRDTVPPTYTIDDDVSFVKDLVKEEVGKGTQLTVIAHSYGGVLSTAALTDFAIPPGSQQAGVSNILFMAAFIPFEGVSLAGIFGGSLPPYLQVTDQRTLVWHNPKQLLYHDLSPEDAIWADDLRNKHHSSLAQFEAPKCTIAAWRKIPVSYLICEGDQGLIPPVQEMMIGQVQSEGIQVNVFRCSGSHSAFISMPEQVAAVALEVMGLK